MKDWTAADKVIGSISRTSEAQKDILNWWYKDLVKRRDDPEGHLVVGWLVRFGIIEDPEGFTIQQRMQKARTGGWDVPSWMDSAV